MKLIMRSSESYVPPRLRVRTADKNFRLSMALLEPSTRIENDLVKVMNCPYRTYEATVKLTDLLYPWHRTLKG